MSGFTASTGPRGRERGQTETLGVILLLAITVIGAMSVVAFGATVLQDARGVSGQEGVSHAMTQFDSQAAIVALGDAETQSVKLGGAGEGTYTVEPDAGWMSVSHINHSGNDNAQSFINESLGALVYDDGNAEIAYQGGGVWRKRGNGSVMVSPPEFHYRDATLTLPIIRVHGSSSAGGSIRAMITNEMSARPVFPNASEDPYDGHHYQNPVEEGNVTVTIRSDYYQAWAEYFRTRSEGQLDVYDRNQTVRLTLTTGSVLGDFEPVPDVGESLSVKGMSEEHPLNNFTIVLDIDDFNNRHWIWYAEEGGRQFEINVYSPGKCKNSGYNGELDVGVYYYNGSTDYYQGWQNQSVDPEGKDFNVDCDESTITMNFTGDTPLNYTSIEVSQGQAGWEYKDRIEDDLDSAAPSITFDQHPGVDNDETFVRDSGDNASIGFVVDHYFSLLGPSLDLVTEAGPGDGNPKVNYADSSGTIDYSHSEGSVITFLHVTENKIRVEFR